MTDLTPANGLLLDVSTQGRSDVATGAPSSQVPTVAVVAAVVLLAITTTSLACARPAVQRDPHSALLWPLLAVVLIPVEKLHVRLPTRRSSQTFNLTELVVLIGAALLPPDELLLGVFTGFVLAQVFYRRPLIKSVFNVANEMVGTGITFLVLSCLPAGDRLLSVPGALLMVAAVVGAETVGCLDVVAVVTAQGGFPGRTHLAGGAIQILVVSPLSLSIGVAAIAAYENRAWALIGFALPMYLVAWSYRRSENVRSRFADLQRVYAYSKRLARAHDKTDVLQVALSETRKVMHCEQAEVSLPGPEGLIRYRLDYSDGLIEELVELRGPEAEAIESQNPVLLGASSHNAYLQARGLKDMMAVPLAVGGVAGVLAVADRHGSSDTSFDRSETDFLQALAAHLSTALTSSEYLDDLRRSVAQREHQAFHDALTGMGNRTLFTNVVTASLEQSGSGQTTAVVLIDLDEFRSVNEALGHNTGDRVLKMVGSRVSTVVREVGMAARLGGDEFAFLVPNATAVEEVVGLAEKVLEAIAAPLEIDTVNFNVRAAVGIAIAPLHGRDATTLLKSADVAMYAAKRSGRRIQVYESSMDKSSARRLGLATDLARAIENNQLELWYQPVAEIATGQVEGFEALLRWPHPEHGFVSPDEFIPISEQTGLIEPLTWWVLKQALGELRRWRDNGFEFSMAVNVSVRSLLDPSIVERVRSMVADFGLAPPCLTLEITESAMMVDFERCETVLRRISDMGVKIAIDDFGTGYSSLSRLKVLPVHVVKIDRSFVKSICFDRGDQAVVKSVIELAGVMGHRTVAEGIEDLTTWSRLAALGCELGQGYYFARPMPAEHCRAWVTERQQPSLAVVRELGARRVEHS